MVKPITEDDPPTLDELTRFQRRRSNAKGNKDDPYRDDDDDGVKDGDDDDENEGSKMANNISNTNPARDGVDFN